MEEFFDLEPQTDCLHPEYETDNGVNICKHCFCEIVILDHDGDWKTMRCYVKNPKKGDIKSVFTECKIPNGVVNKATIEKTEEKYKKIVKDDTARGDNRKGIVAACLYYVFLEMGEIKTVKDLEIMFNLKREKISEGMHAYRIVFPDSRTQTIKPCDLIKKTIKQVGISKPDAYEDILEISKNIENRDMIINRSSPQSVAPALVYFYLCLNPEYKKLINYNKKSFALKVELSEITLTRIIKRIADIYEKKYDKIVNIV